MEHRAGCDTAVISETLHLLRVVWPGTHFLGAFVTNTNTSDGNNFPCSSANR